MIFVIFVYCVVNQKSFLLLGNTCIPSIVLLIRSGSGRISE